jgi:2-oxoisovalerate dehydrogenase E1 component
MSSKFVVKPADKGKGYGMESHIVDGNNILEVYNLLSELKAS